MKTLQRILAVLTLLAFLPTGITAAEWNAVPGQVQYSGAIAGASGPVGVTFALYAEQSGGNALWMETQNVSVDASGAYNALLGAETSGGIPQDIFASGEARWLEVSYTDAQGETVAQPRVLLVSVPYAMKAGDAQTLGGLPASAFVLNPNALYARVSAAGGVAAAGDVLPSTAVAGTGTLNKVAKWIDGAGTLGDSLLFDNGFVVGLGTTTPGAALHISLQDASIILGGAGTHSLAVQGTGSNGRLGQDNDGFFFSSDTNGKALKMLTQSNNVLQEWMRITAGGQIGMGTQTPSAALHLSQQDASFLIDGLGTHSIALQGPGSNGRFGQDGQGMFFASDTNGRDFKFLTNNGALNEWMRITSAGNVGVGTTTPAAKLDVNGTAKMTNIQITGGTPGAGKVLTSDASGNGTWQTPASGGATLGANTFSATQTLSAGNLALPATADANNGVITSGGSRFIHRYGANDTFLGLNAGNFTMTGTGNTGVGANALVSNTTGSGNVANGYQALSVNTTGASNTAVGFVALSANNGGSQNAAVGNSALVSNTTGTNNTAVGFQAGYTLTGANANTTGSANTYLGANSGPGSATQFTNATAIGANAVVSQNDSLVLGSIAGVNGATNSVKVGIGTATPTQPLDVTGIVRARAGIQLDPGTAISCPNCLVGQTITLDDTTVSGDVTVNGSVTINAAGLAASVKKAMANSPYRSSAAGDLTVGGSIGANQMFGAFIGDGSGLSNLPVSGVSGTGTINNLAKFTGTTAVGNSLLFDNGTNVGIGTTTPGAKLDVVGGLKANSLALPDSTSSTLGVITHNGNRFLHTYGGNLFLGDNAGNFTNVSTNNMGIGFSALSGISFGYQNMALGHYSLQANGSGAENVALGYNTLTLNTSGNNNTALGTKVLQANILGNGNTGIGDGSLFSNTADVNTALGATSMVLNTTGNSNSAVGVNALYGNTTGSGNTAIGFNAGYPSVTSFANANTTGNKNTFIGSEAGPGSTTQYTNSTAIGANAVVTASNVVVLGSINGVNGAVSGVSVGIGTSAPATKLQVVGDIRVGTTGTNGCVQGFGGAALTGTCSSDERLKKDIRPFASLLERFAQLQPVNYLWRSDEYPDFQFGAGRMNGLIAQQVQQLFPELVETDEKGFYRVNYSELPLYTIEAVKELKAENDSLQADVARQREVNAELQERLARLESLIEQRLGSQVSKLH